MDTRELPLTTGSIKEGGEELSKTPRSLDFHAPSSIPTEIDNTNRNFKGQQKNEVVQCFCRKHWIVLFPQAFGLLVILTLPPLILLFSEELGLLSQLIAPIVLLLSTYYFHYFFLRVFNYYLQTLIITNHRLIELNQTLFFTRIRDSIDLREMQNIEIKQKGVLETLLNYGELIITLSSAPASKRFINVPNPEYHFRKLNKTKREYIMGRRQEKEVR